MNILMKMDTTLMNILKTIAALYPDRLVNLSSECMSVISIQKIYGSMVKISYSGEKVECHDCDIDGRNEPKGQ